MTALEFIAAVAWPVSILIIALLFRRPTMEVLSGQLGRMKAGPFEVEWKRALSEVEAELDRPPKQKPGDVADFPTEGLSAELGPLANRAPAAAIMEAHDRIEQLLQSMVGDPDHEANNRPGIVGLARSALQQGAINKETVGAVEGLSVLRNLAVHGPSHEVSPARAHDYLVLADAVAYAISRGKRPRDN